MPLMPFTALICAYHESSDAGGLRATLPLAGRFLIERQAWLAVDSGAKSIIIVIDEKSPQLAIALDRLYAEGLDIVVASNAGESARAVQANDSILLIADGVIGDKSHVTRLVAAEDTALLTVPSLHFGDHFEQIDAESRWGGLAMIDGQMLKHVAAMLQDWDLQSTLLRCAVQNDVRHIDFDGDQPGAMLVAAECASDLAVLENSILANAGMRQNGWISRYLLAPVEQLVVRRIMPAATSPEQMWLVSLIFILLSATAFMRGWLLSGLSLYLLASLFDGIGERLARLRIHGSNPANWIWNMLPFAAGASLLALGFTLASASGWGCIVLAIVIIAFMVAQGNEIKQMVVPAGAFIAEYKGMGWLMLPFGAMGQWVVGLGVVCLYALVSFFMVQRQVHAFRKVIGQD